MLRARRELRVRRRGREPWKGKGSEDRIINRSYGAKDLALAPTGAQDARAYWSSVPLYEYNM
ncbi:hypothetical protein JCM24511_05491 [Saitozyma sp. JCM 24511]|nr:hypothetical protein JCM24511_05491 [Saitozyma sp. JCM 24511]